MTRKLAFISPVPIRLSKDLEKSLNFRVDDIEVKYRHPVLYIERILSKDKEYIYIYSGSVTYVLMKVKPQNLDSFLRAIMNALGKHIDAKSLNALLGTIELYSELSDLLDSIYYDALKKAKRLFKEYEFTLLYFDYELRKFIRSALIRGLAKVTLDDTIYSAYLRLPSKIRDRLTFDDFKKVVMTEVSIKNLVNAIKKN